MRASSPLAAVVIAILTVASPNVHAQGNDPARTLFEFANRERVAHNLPPLRWNAPLAAAAEQHASRMAAQNTLSHQLPGEPAMIDRASRAGAQFSALAENVAEGPNAEEIHHQWMKSPPHRANLLDPQFDAVGIAVTVRSGTLFAVEDFSLEAGKLSIEEQERIVNAKLRSRGLHLLTETTDARRSCVLDNGYAGKRVPSFVLHYATPDLGTLPDMLEQRIRAGKYRAATVGACPSNGKVGLSNYRIAVLLFE